MPSRLTDGITVRAGFNHSLARKCKSTVVGVGRTTYGQSRVPSGMSSAVAIGVGGVASSTGTWCADCTSTP